MSALGSTCLVLRTNRFGAREQAFLGGLQAATGYAVAVAADEQAGAVDCGGFAKISVTRQTAGRLGLHCPADFGWRCGDYSLYLARAAMPQMRHFWIVEPDVRLAGGDYRAAFAQTEGAGADLISPDLRLSEPEHFWHPTMRERTDAVYRCCFGLARFSARALDYCLAERRADRGRPWPRLMWPNDETFTATLIAGAGLEARDLNSFGAPLYRADTFGFFTICRGETLEACGTPGLFYHPVLWGEDFERKQARMNRGVGRSEAMRLKLLRGVMIRRYQRLVGLGGLVGRTRPIVRHDQPE